MNDKIWVIILLILIASLFLISRKHYKEYARYEYPTPFSRYDTWTGNTHINKKICDEIDISTIPMNIRLYIDSLRHLDSIFYYIDEKSIYKRYKKSEPSLIWEEVDNNKCSYQWIPYIGDGTGIDIYKKVFDIEIPNVVRP